MPHTCIVPGCKSGAKYKLFGAPYTNKDRWEAWKNICPWLKKYRTMQLQSVRFCHLHFHPDHLNRLNKLTADAIPSLNLPPNPPKDLVHPNSQLTTTDNLLTSVLSEHNYTKLTPQMSSSQLEPKPGLSGTTTSTGSIDLPMSFTVPCHLNVIQELDPSGTTNSTNDLSMPPTVPCCNLNAIAKPGPSGTTNLTNDFSMPPTVPCNLNVIAKPGPSGTTNLTISNDLFIPTTEPCNVTTELGPSGSIDLPMPPTCLNVTTPTRRSNSRITKKDTVPRVRLPLLNLTPRKKMLKDNANMLKSKLRLWKSKYYNLKRKSNLINCPKTLNFIKKYKSLDKFGKILVDSQLRLTGVKPQGRRYTSDEKIFSLSLSKLSRKCYTHLRKYFILPCKSTLNTLLTNVPLRPGINDFVLQHLADATIGKSELEKQCCLLFDEMAINKNLHFNFNTGVIEGFEDLGSGQRSSNVADKALVFMLRGLFSPWKFPVAFYFARDGVKTFVLKNIIKEIVTAVTKTGFCIRATVSDQGSANVAAIKSLIADTREELLRSNESDPNDIFYKIGEHTIYHIFDVPHLLKCFRNNFQKKDLLLNGKTAQWSFLEMLYRVDGAGGKARSIKLTDKHINPQSYDKMKVKLAAQVFSRQVSTSLDQKMPKQKT